MPALNLTWDEILGQYDWMYSQCVKSEAMMGRWGSFASGMLALIPQIRNLHDIKDVKKWLSHFCLVMQVPDKEIELVILYYDDSYVIKSYLPGHKVEAETNAIAEEVVSEILKQINRMREE